MDKTGRPTSYSPEIAEAICEENRHDGPQSHGHLLSRGYAEPEHGVSVAGGPRGLSGEIRERERAAGRYRIRWRQISVPTGVGRSGRITR
jgi:hypothetical protein